jgi:hypothetical protein
MTVRTSAFMDIGAGRCITTQLVRAWRRMLSRTESLFFSFSSLKVLCVKTSEVLGRCMGSLETNLYAFEIPALHVGVMSPANVRRFGRHI